MYTSFTSVMQAWRRHEYATIAASTVSMHLAEIALAPANRERLLARNRRLIRDGYARLKRWVDTSEGLLSMSPPDATALGFVRYHVDAPSVEVTIFAHSNPSHTVLLGFSCSRQPSGKLLLSQL